MNETQLRSHPATPCTAVRNLAVRITEAAGGSLHLVYSLKASQSKLRIPATVPAVRAEELWRHTCFEVFVRRAGEKGYVEFNFSPSGEWAAYRFRSYRKAGASLDEIPPPEMRVRQTARRLEVEAVINPRPLLAPNGQLQLGVSAVIEATDGALSYWALQHPSEKPDFHHPDSFAISLDAGSLAKT